jgi:hypothetical protein
MGWRFPASLSSRERPLLDKRYWCSSHFLKKAPQFNLMTYTCAQVRLPPATNRLADVLAKCMNDATGVIVHRTERHV